ncbi:MAG: nickel pincer cofactor biosynthesis protein LarC [Geitlerinemataceae cyanobacterium]
MCLGALVEAGVPVEYLQKYLDRLGIAGEYRLRVERVLKNDQAATKLHVDLRDRETGEFCEEGEGGQLEPVEKHHHSHDAHHHHSHARAHDSGHHSHGHHSHDHPSHDHPSHGTYHHHRTLRDIEALIDRAQLPDRARDWSLAVFCRLARAESEVHGKPIDEVHFHEVGGIDAIVDIVGTCLGLDWLDVEAVYCSALPTGGGTVWAAHGRMPVPVPAVLKLWQMRRVPVYDNGIDRELVTPTGAALMVELATEFGRPPAIALEKVGWGAGTIALKLPNALRLWVGTTSDVEPPQSPSSSLGPPDLLDSSSSLRLSESPESLGATETVAVLETQIDDLSPQAIGYAFDKLFEAGALDVFTTAIGMKKSRTGLALTVICHPDRRVACETVIFRETTTLGIRHRLQSRTILAREFEAVELDGDTVQIKIARDRQGAIVNAQPEYEDVARVARTSGRSWSAVQQAARRTYFGSRSSADAG